MDKRKIADLVGNRKTREHLIDYKLLDIKYTQKAVELLADVDEDMFFHTLSKTEFDKPTLELEKERGGFFYINTKQFWFDLVEMPPAEFQMQNTFSLWIFDAQEELKRRKDLEEISRWIEDNEIEFI